MSKICKKCGRELPFSEFYNDSRYKDGCLNICKECRKKQKKQWYQNNREGILVKEKQYADEHKDERNKYSKIYYQLNKEDMLIRAKEYYYTKIGRSSNLAKAYKSEDIKNGRDNNVTAQFIQDNIFTSKCIYCGETDWKELGCDRIDNSIGHIIGNIVCCCEKCNKERGTKPFAEFYAKKKG